MIESITVTLLTESGIGFDVFGSPELLSTLQVGKKVTLWIHHHRTEVSETLFGFIDADERSLFRELNKVNGVGGKTALSLLGLGSETLLKAIQLEDDKLLSTVPGIGKKTAQKIIVDLKGSIDLSRSTPKNEQKNSKNRTAVISSLVQMGYDKIRVEEIVELLDESLSLPDMVKEAIKRLNTAHAKL